MSDTTECALLRCLSGIPAKDIARAADVSVATAARYRGGITTPDGLTLIRLMRNSPPVMDTVLRLLGLDDEAMAAREADLMRLLEETRKKRDSRDNEVALQVGRRAGAMAR
jgi:hypothetical protein